jgi:hypothetical protein
VRGFGDSLGSYRRAFKQLRVEGVQLPEMEHYVHRTYAHSDVLPWAHLIGPLPAATLAAHAAEAEALFALPSSSEFLFDESAALPPPPPPAAAAAMGEQRASSAVFDLDTA